MADVVDPNPALKPLSAVVLRIVADHPPIVSGTLPCECARREGERHSCQRAPTNRRPTRTPRSLYPIKDIASSLHDQLNTDLRICPIGRPRRTWRRWSPWAEVRTTVSLLAHLSGRELAAFGGTVITGTLSRVAHSRRAEHNKALSDW